MSTTGIDKEALLAGLPPPWPDDLLSTIRGQIEAADRCFVILDDDPTGGQTLHGLPVLAAWDSDTLAAEIERSPAFFLLTNSRALPETEAVALAEDIGRRLREVAALTGRELAVGSRGDSTLRGHFPAETDALYRGLTGGPRRPAYVFAPFFAEGGRFTINDTQYVQQGPHLLPAGETEFARDPSFAYEHSHLPAWIEARTGGVTRAGDVVSLSIAELRTGGPAAVTARLQALRPGGVVIPNAACDRDLEVFVSGLLAAEAGGARFLYRTAASFVRIRAGITPRSLLGPDDLGGTGAAGLIVVGSYVDRTSRQLEALLRRDGTQGVELQIDALLDSDGASEVARAAAEVERGLGLGRDVVLYTSRQLRRAAAGLDFVAIGHRITDALCDVLGGLRARPGFLIVKGGSTAHGVAIRGLGLKRGVVLGQLLPGVPVWRLGPESKYPNLPYVVFPGNVGDADALSEAVNSLRGGRDAGAG